MRGARLTALVALLLVALVGCRRSEQPFEIDLAQLRRTEFSPPLRLRIGEDGAELPIRQYQAMRLRHWPIVRLEIDYTSDARFAVEYTTAAPGRRPSDLSRWRGTTVDEGSGTLELDLLATPDFADHKTLVVGFVGTGTLRVHALRGWQIPDAERRLAAHRWTQLFLPERDRLSTVNFLSPSSWDRTAAEPFTPRAGVACLIALCAAWLLCGLRWGNRAARRAVLYAMVGSLLLYGTYQLVRFSDLWRVGPVGTQAKIRAHLRPPDEAALVAKARAAIPDDGVVAVQGGSGQSQRLRCFYVAPAPCGVWTRGAGLYTAHGRFDDEEVDWIVSYNFAAPRITDQSHLLPEGFEFFWKLHDHAWIAHRPSDATTRLGMAGEP